MCNFNIFIWLWNALMMHRYLKIKVNSFVSTNTKTEQSNFHKTQYAHHAFTHVSTAGILTVHYAVKVMNWLIIFVINNISQVIQNFSYWDYWHLFCYHWFEMEQLFIVYQQKRSFQYLNYLLIPLSIFYCIIDKFQCWFFYSIYICTMYHTSIHSTQLIFW
jgi:hypothetical protein